jgi:hypothetical protein
VLNREWKRLALAAAVFAVCFFLPVGSGRFDSAVTEALRLVRWYARRHVLTCLIPAFFIAGAIAVFVGQASVMKYLGAKANKVVAYGVASVSGSILAVCSCTVLPLFAGIYRMGAGLGPATAFLYSGPAINVLAIVLTARVLGLELGIARAVGAIVFSIVIGLLMHVIFPRQQPAGPAAPPAATGTAPSRPLWKTAAYFAAMVAILVFANWAHSGNVRAVFLCCPGGLKTYEVEGTIVKRGQDVLRIREAGGAEREIAREQLQDIRPAGNEAWSAVHAAKWLLVAIAAAALAIMLLRWFRRGELAEWVSATWGLAKQILPLLLIGVLVAGLLLGRPDSDSEGLIPSRWIHAAVGGNSLRANALASVAGALMYFATLTEVPIVQGLLTGGMGKGPALALLLAGPALSLPNMLVIRSVMGTRKTLVYVLLVVVMATVSGMIFGALF